MSFRIIPSTLRFLILVAIMGTACIVPRSVSATSSVQSLPLGSYWTLSSTTHQAMTGSGAYTGTLDKWIYQNDTYTVVERTDDTIVISISSSDSWFTTATDWMGHNSELWRGSNSSKSTENIDLTTLMYNQSESTDFLLLNPQGLSQGGTVDLGPQGVSEVSSGGVAPQGSVVYWNVSAGQPVNINGVSVSVWSLTHKGYRITSFWNASETSFNGSGIFTLIFDSTFGIRLGDSVATNFYFSDQGGGRTETGSIVSQISNTNINFPSSNLFSFIMQQYVLGGIVVAIVAVVVVLMLRRRNASNLPPPPPPPI